MVIPLANDIDIIKATSSLKNKKSHKKEVPVSIFKRNIIDLATPLRILFNQPIRTGKFPNLLKNANITPIHKAGPPTDQSNYRPISKLPIISKLFETLVKESLIKYFTSKNILTPHQFGFRKGFSTFDALNKFSNDIYIHP